MLFRGFASKATLNMATNVSWLSGNAWGLWRLACPSDGWCLTRRMDRTSVKVCLPASWQTAARLPSWAACELAAVPDGQASHIFVFPGSGLPPNLFFCRGLADFAILSSKIALWLAFFQSREPAWPASLWQPPDCLPAHWTGTLPKCLPAGLPIKFRGCPAGLLWQLLARPAGRPTDQLAADWLPGLTGPCHMRLPFFFFFLRGRHFF